VALYVLVPPSEGKAPGGIRAVGDGAFDASLAVPRRAVRTALTTAVANANPAAQSKILGVRGPLLERAREATQALGTRRALVLPAWQRYEGVVWQHLDPATLRPTQRRCVLVPSALYGLTTAEDNIADYRLTFGVRLAGVGRLDDYWRPSLTAAVIGHVKRGTVVNVLPVEHDNALDHDQLSDACNVVTVRFLSASGSGAAGHAAKAVKGVVARLCLTDGLDALDGFTWQGWRVRRTPRGYDVTAPASSSTTE